MVVKGESKVNMPEEIVCKTCRFNIETCPVKKILYMKRTYCSYWKGREKCLTPILPAISAVIPVKM